LELKSTVIFGMHRIATASLYFQNPDET
jgi:hypothetical protein